jgi:hypothetical protein
MRSWFSLAWSWIEKVWRWAPLLECQRNFSRSPRKQPQRSSSRIGASAWERQSIHRLGEKPKACQSTLKRWQNHTKPSQDAMTTQSARVTCLTLHWCHQEYMHFSAVRLKHRARGKCMGLTLWMTLLSKKEDHFSHFRMFLRCFNALSTDLLPH